MYAPAVLLPLLLSTASALRITSIKTSGTACPSTAAESVTSAGTLSDLTVTLPAYDVSLDASQGQNSSTNCALMIAFDKGEVGKSLVLESVKVWSGLTLEAGGAATLFTSAFWSENPSNTIVARRETSSTPAYADNVSINSDLGVPSSCVEESGNVGILNVNFRVLATKGVVTLGPETVGGKKQPATEHLGFKWVDC
ncbi:uncharacterized protein DNG_02750 [Cephalotrichum gorgonifer]|uniref:Uncharacterized protein n=1 Tax=Cephalotrichum gorgonifer TaxID=2041049 RepID=A0AAE8MU36_9PEZI|nr:uncharacterized protein DNG_02750 [Cephalotrichum gorgonifer]